MSTLIQSPSGGNTGSVSSVTVTFDSTAVADNLLILCLAVRNGMTPAPSAPSGWTAGPVAVFTDVVGSNNSGVVFYKISDGTETAVSVSWSDNGHPHAVMCEYEPIGSWTFDAENEDLTGMAVNIQSQATGAATATTSTGTAFALLMSRHQSAWGISNTIDNSFTIDVNASFTSTGVRPTVSMGHLDYTSSGSKSATWSNATAGGQAYGAILVFQDSGAGGPTFPIGTLSLLGVGI